MQDDNDVSFIKTITVNELPCELVVAGFADEYSAYLEQYRSREPVTGSLVSLLLSLAAWMLIVVGGVTIIFGPNSVTYNLRAGPTFLQFIQIYPGPIVSVGSLLLALCKHMDDSFSTEPLTPELFLLTFYDVQLPDGMEDLTGFSLSYVEGALFQIAHL
ncbi:hypothetical protein [Pseudomonas sp. NPDC089734]|uniref:hypothetical protein n=1 Tax=Pseudomonas sp. NPDC089734 TaxID=3364469 RepID=UPI0038038318